MNPFTKVKEQVIVEMLKYISKRKRLTPEKMIEKLVYDAYHNQSFDV